MKPYILLTPGPLTTSQTVKEAMLTDWCTWDEDYNLHIVEEIRKSLVSLATQHTGDYTSILLQGSGTYCVEAVIGSVIKPGDKLLILSNGATATAWATLPSITASRTTCLLSTKQSKSPSATSTTIFRTMPKSLTLRGALRNHYRRAQSPQGDSPPRQDARQETDCRRHEQLRRCSPRCTRTGHRLPHQQCQQVHPGCSGVWLHHRPPFRAVALQGRLQVTLSRHLRPMGSHGERTWQMAFYFSYTRGPRLQASHGRTGRGGRCGGPSQQILREPPRAGRRHAFPRFPNVAAGRDSIARYYFFPLSSCRFQFQSFLHTTERAWICHLSGKDFASRHFPYRQYRRCSSRRFPAADRDNSRV